MMWRGKKCPWPELQDKAKFYGTHTSCPSHLCLQKYKNLHFPNIVLFTIVGFEPELLQCLLNAHGFWSTIRHSKRLVLWLQMGLDIH